MKKVILSIVSIIMLVSPYAQSTSEGAKTHVVHDFFLKGISQFNEHNLDEFCKQFDEAIQMYTPTGWLRGIDDVKARFVETFKQFPNVHMDIEQLRVTEINSKTVVVDFKWHTYPQGKGPAFHGVGSGVYVKKKGRWVEVLEHETVTKVDDGIMPKSN